MYIWLNCIYLYLNVYCQCLMLTVCTRGLRVTQFQFSVCMYCTCGRIDNKADLTWLINTAVLPPSSWRLSSIRWHHLPLHHRPNISIQTTRHMLGIFRNLRSICRPQDRLFLFLFIFHQTRPPSSGFRHDRCSLLNQSHALLRRPEVAAAGLQRARATPQFSPQQSLIRFPLRLLSLHRGSPSCSASMQPGL